MKTSKFCAVPLAAALVLTAATAAATAQTAAPAATRVALTNADNGRAVAAAVGDDVEVRLTGYRERGLNWSWSLPQSDAPDVLKRTAGTVTPAGGARAVFHAQRLGTGKLTATRRCRPDPGNVCPLVVAPWKVTVDVK